MLQNGYTSVETTVSKSLPLPTYLYFKKNTPPFSLILRILPPPPSTPNTGPPLAINNEQSLSVVKLLYSLDRCTILMEVNKASVANPKKPSMPNVAIVNYI